MRRWNGWGDDTLTYPLPEHGREFLSARLGPGVPVPDAPLTRATDLVPATHLPENSLYDTSRPARLLHARGQSLPDWIALRYGRIPAFPDAVAWPQSDAEVSRLIRLAQSEDIKVIPYGGGTSVVGHINPSPDHGPVLTLNMRRLNGLREFDRDSRLATFGAGIAGPELEAQLRARGFTLGHFPQSFEYSTLGGWIATRSSGQQSLGYGRIESLFAGGTVEAPAGTISLLPHPASAAGPDLRHVILGSEGRLGVITAATVRISPLPQRENFHAFFFADFEQGCRLARQVAGSGLPLSMLRLSTARETTTMLALAGHQRLVKTLESLLSLRNIREEKCLLLVGFTGREDVVKMARRAVVEMVSRMRGIHVGRAFGNQWLKDRFRTPYLRNALWEEGYAVDTLETATTWSGVPSMVEAIEQALEEAMARFDERLHVFSHLSHLYESGASIYTTFVFRLASDADELLARWRCLKAAASEAIIAHKGTISHQHGVGADHRQYLPAEKGRLGMEAIRSMTSTFDPAGIMNPGKLLD